MARVPCKHFQESPPNRRRCPFGRNCFYQHLNADGTPYIFPDNPNPRRWIRTRDLDDLSESLERLRRSIPELFGDDAPQTEQQRRLVDLALDVGRTLTRFNFAQSEIFNPLGIFLAHHLTRLDEAQRDAAEGTAGDVIDDQPRPEVADAILAAPDTTAAMDTPGPVGNDEQGGESSGTGNETVAGNSHPAEPASLPGDINLIQAEVTPGNVRSTVESTTDITPPGEGSSGTREDRSSTTDCGVERAEVGLRAQIERPLEAGDSSQRTEAQPHEGTGGLVGSSGGTIPDIPPTPIHHDPHPPFETDGRGRVVWSNSSQSLRSRSSPPAPLRRSGDGEVNAIRGKENDGTAGRGVRDGLGNNGDADSRGQGVRTGGMAAEVP